jgi:hypothetical protein
MWTVIESNIGIVCACLPMLRIPLAIMLKPILPADLSLSHSSVANYSHTGTAKNEWDPPSEAQDVELNKVGAGSQNQAIIVYS